MELPRKPQQLLFQLLPIFFISVVIVVASMNFKSIRQFLIGALGDNGNIVIDTTATQGTLKRPWRNLAQGGESKDWKPGPLTGQIKALNTEYIRLDHIYDFYDIVHKEGGRLSFDFSKLDLVINDILASGAKPYISLSYTPPALAVNGDITAPPANWNEWQLTVQKTIEHVSGNRGIQNVYYEVWNEPDLFGNYKTYGERNYLDLYTYAARGAKNAQGVAPFKIGGPAITALYKNWVDAMATRIQQENIPFDFFSWHRYSTDIEVFRNDVAIIHTWLEPYPLLASIELHVTEWGHNPKNDPGYDGTFGAIHTIAMSTEFSGMIDKAFAFEIQDGKDPAGQQHWGRWGIFDSTGQAKPRYLALRFLEKLGNDRLQLLGRGTWVKGIAAKDGADTTAIIVNYDADGKHFETTPVTFTHLEPGTFELEKQQFGGTLSKQQIATSEAQLQINLPMSPNTAVFLRLHRQ